MWSWFQRKEPVAAEAAETRQEATSDTPAAEPGFFFQTKASVLTDTGIREHNEDAVCILTHPDARLRSVKMVGLADGMGGHAAGEVASRECLLACQNSVGQALDAPLHEQLHQAVVYANQQVWQQAQAQPELEGMGTTLCLLAFDGGDYQCAWVGDSRIYRLRGGELLQLTQDDTVVNLLLQHGVISAEEALRHPEKHVLSQALGTAPQVDHIHLGEPAALQHDDLFLLVSDGVHDVLTHDELARLLGSDIHASGQRIVEEAKLAGSQDNLSAVLVHVQLEPVQALDRAPGKVTTLEVPACG